MAVLGLVGLEQSPLELQVLVEVVVALTQLVQELLPEDLV
jgi:hypothetical protein